MTASGRLKTFLHSYLLQADSGFTDPTEAAELKRKRTFKKYTYRGIELDKLLDLKNEEFIDVSLTMAWAACSALPLTGLSTLTLDFRNCSLAYSSSTPVPGEGSSEVSSESLWD